MSTTYDLNGQNFEVEINTQYYNTINVQYKDGDVLVILLETSPRASQGNTSSFESQNSASGSSKSANQLQECNALFPPRLSIGRNAKVIVFQVTVRYQPNMNASKVNYYARDRILEVIDGPVCSDNYYWWNLYSAELEYGGWVVEADDENYYLAPH